MLELLREIFRLTLAGQADLNPPLDSLRNWVEGLLTTRLPLGPGRAEQTLVDQIISQLDVLQERLSGLLRTNAGSGAQYEMLSFRVAAIRSEQSKMAGILACVAEAGLVGRGQVVKLIKWLKKVEKPDSIMTTVLMCVTFWLKPWLS